MRGFKVPFLSVAALAGVALLTGSAVAQVVTANQPRNDAGFGTIKRSFNISSRVRPGNGGNSDVRITSAVFIKADGKTYVSSDNDREDHRIYVLDAVGNYESFFDIGATIQEGTILYDMASDGVSLIIAVGEGTGGSFGIGEEAVASHAGIYIVDTAGNLVNQVIGDNGPRAITNPIRGDGYARMKSFHYDRWNSDELWDDAPYRGVAFDPSGDGGNGSLWVSTDGGLADGTDEGQPTRNAPILQIDLDGKVLLELAQPTAIDMEPLDKQNLLRSDGSADPNPSSTDPNPRLGMPIGGLWLGSGLALDNQTGNLWVLHEEGTEDIIEIDSTTGVPTGKHFDQERFTDNFRGGLDGILGGDPGGSPSDFDMLVLSRVNGDDHIAYQRMNLYPNLPGVSEPFLEGGINGGPLGTASPIVHNDTDTLDFGINLNGQSVGPALLFMNFADEGRSDVPTILPIGTVPELRSYSNFSTPVSSGSALLVPTSTGAATSIDLGAIGFPVNTGDTIRMQAIYFDLRSQFSPGLMASNEIWFNGLVIRNVLYEATGPVAENADTSSGFFRIHWLGGSDIVEVTLDFIDSSALGQNGRFDTDAVNMADIFGLGNGGGPGCQGTYRNGSDALTGLVYDAMTNTAIGADSPICDYYADQGASWLSGFVGTPGPAGGGDSYQRLTFNFTDFGLDGAGNPAAGPEIFEFDADTDSVLNDGGAHADMVITVTLRDGTVFKANSLPDVSDPQRSFIGF